MCSVTSSCLKPFYGVTVRVAFRVTPFVAEIVTVLVNVTVFVLTVKVAVVEPADTVALEGTVATPVLLLVSVTTVPPEGASPFRFTVPVEVPPPFNDVGFSETEVSVAAVTVKLVVGVVPA